MSSKEALEDLEDGFWECSAILESGFGVDLDEGVKRGSIILPGLSVRADLDSRVEEAPVWYDGRTNDICLSPRVTESEITRSYVGEEVAHWLRRNLSPIETNFFDTLEEYKEFVMRKRLEEGNLPSGLDSQMRNGSVDEFFGRLGRNMVREYKGKRWSSYGLEVEDPVPVDSVETAEELRALLRSEKSRYKNELTYLKDRMEHFAGYRAADMNYERAKADEGILSKSNEEIREEYGIDELELEFAERSASF